MAKRYFLSFLICDQDDPLLCEVRKSESDRLASILAEANDSSLTEFFWFKTVDGKSIAINLRFVQVARFLWEPAESPSDTARNEGMVYICLRGRHLPLETYTESPDRLFELFMNLQYGPDVVPFPKFDDEDGETLQLNAREVVWVMAPTHLIEEGEQMVIKEDGLDV